MSGEVIAFIIMSVIFLAVIVMLEMYGCDEKEETSAKNNAEVIRQNKLYHNRDLSHSIEELKKVG